MQRVVEEKIERLIQECDKHILRINSAAGKLQNTMPLTADRYEQLTEEQIEHFDQFLFRFAKLQDALGQRLFRAILALLQEDVEGVPFIDILHKLEKLELITSAELWIEVREIRNEIAHQYDDVAELAALSLNKIFDARTVLFETFSRLKACYSAR